MLFQGSPLQKTVRNRGQNAIPKSIGKKNITKSMFTSNLLPKAVPPPGSHVLPGVEGLGLDHVRELRPVPGAHRPAQGATESERRRLGRKEDGRLLCASQSAFNAPQL